jgi:two-component system CheB/CheR fusion protein
MPLGTAIRQTLAQRQVATYKDVSLKVNDEIHTLSLTVQPILKPSSLQGLMVVLFEESQAPQEIKVTTEPIGEGAQRVAKLERELEATREYLQAIVEELESSNEEIKSTNEELQSANEELKTSQEETQSINEELVTLNTELQNKIEELTWVNSDIDNVLASIDVGIIFLDRHMYIRRFNQAATQVAHLIETDLGRPIGHIVSKLAYADWIPEARRVFETLVSKEIEVPTKTGEWFLMRVRPYRTVENAIEGVVMTFTNITEQKQAAEVVEAERTFAESIVDTVNQPLLVLDTELRVISANTAFYEAFKVKAEETRGQLIYELGNHQWNIPRLRHLLEEIIPQHNVFEGFEVAHEFPVIGRKKMRLNARQIEALNKQPALILLAIEDVTE